MGRSIYLTLINGMKVCICVIIFVWSVPLCVFGATLPSGPIPSSHVEEPVRCNQGSCWYLGPYFKFVPICVDGNCQCNAPRYSKITCLPCVGSCYIRKFRDDFSGVHAKPFDSSPYGPGTVYSCIGKGGRQADVHVLSVDGVYGQRSTIPPTPRPMNVSITSSPALTRPIILVLTNYEPVNWILDFHPNLNIRKVILIAYHSNHSSVTPVSGVSPSIVVEKWPTSTPLGYGSDIGGGNTAEMLAILTDEFGAVASFAGTYRTESWDWYLPSVCHEIHPTTTAVTPHSTPTMTRVPVPSESTPTYEVEPISCLDNSCWHVGSPLRFNASCLNGRCECNAPNYNKISCLPYVGSCQIRSFETNSDELHARPSLYPLQPNTVYSCIGEGSISANVHVLGVNEGSIKTQPPTPARISVLITSLPTATRPVIIVLTNYEPVDWSLAFPPFINIEKVILISHYSDLSSVTIEFGNSQSLTVERRPSGTPGGYGTDRDGGNTAQMLVDLTEEFGAVASFAGTYKANYWFLDLTAVDGQVTPKTEEVLNQHEVEITEDTWTEFSFSFEDNWNSCHGAQYVRKRPISNHALGQYVGAILCSNDRYKLVMADDLNDEFKNIADTSGHGSDHCEFVGAPRNGIFTLDENSWDSPSATGYYRSFWGEDMKRGGIGGGIGASWTGRYYVKWYECGVSIP